MKSKSNNRTRVKVDIERNKRVETNAVNAAFNYYERHGYRVISVEKDNCGWDLEAVMSNERLLVEVKGVSSSNVEVSLTPNEYKNMKSHVDKYRLFILTNALKENECKEFIFFHMTRILVNGEIMKKNTLYFENIVSAKVRI